MSGFWGSYVFYCSLSSLKVKVSGRALGGLAGAVPADPPYPALKTVFLPAIFHRSKVTTCNSKANSLIWPRNRPRSRFIPVIVTFMFDKDPIKKPANTISPIGAFGSHAHQSVDPIYSKTCSSDTAHKI